MEGPPEDVEAAQKALEEITNDLRRRMTFAEIDVDQKYHKHIIGKSGANVGRIKDETGVSIRIPPDNENSNIIRIEGSPEGVSKAKEELMQMVHKMVSFKFKNLGTNQFLNAVYHEIHSKIFLSIIPTLRKTRKLGTSLLNNDSTKQLSELKGVKLKRFGIASTKYKSPSPMLTGSLKSFLSVDPRVMLTSVSDICKQCTRNSLLITSKQKFTYLSSFTRT